MGFKGVTAMDQRIRYISEYLDGYYLISELCLQFSISGKTAYKWIKRYEESGAKGLTDRSHKPHYSQGSQGTELTLLSKCGLPPDQTSARILLPEVLKIEIYTPIPDFH